MNFNQIPPNAWVFIDANILVYHFTPHPRFGAECQLLMESIYRWQHFSAYTSTQVMGELAHQLMVMEAAQDFGWPLKGITDRLRKHPAEVKKLTRFRQAIDEVPRLGIEVLPIDRHLPSLAAALTQLHGLLTNDALILATMQDQAITHLASNDADFDGVPGITRYAPV